MRAFDPCAEMLPEKPAFLFRVRTTVVWGDMDALGHVNNTIYLRWFEEARIRYFTENQIIGTTPFSVILAHQRCDYLAPVKYPDVVETRVSISKIGNTSMTMAFEMWSDVLGMRVARGEGVVVGFDYAANRSTAIPDDVRERIFAIESREAKEAKESKG